MVVEVHMVPTGKAEPVRVSVGLYFGEKPSAHVPYMLRLGRQTMDIPPGAARHTVTDWYVVPVDVDVIAVQPHAHLLARQVQAFARMPDGSVEWLIRIDDWDFRWQEVYRYARPISLPRGATIVTQFTYDNSDGNPRNPNRPAKRVTFGQHTSSEMGDVWLQVLTRSDGDRAALHADYAPKMLAEDIAGVEKALDTDPLDGRLHTDLALCYLEADRSAEALTHLREAVRLQPGSASSHYELGTALLREKQLDEARGHFARAVTLKPAFSEAHNNLGVSYFLAGRLTEAIRAFDEAVRTDGGNAEAHFNLARVLGALAAANFSEGETARAVETARQALEHATRSGDEQLAGQIRERLSVYQEHRKP
jgi:Flp pilus assembly protein TadD